MLPDIVGKQMNNPGFQGHVCFRRFSGSSSCHKKRMSCYSPRRSSTVPPLIVKAPASTIAAFMAALVFSDQECNKGFVLSRPLSGL